MVVADAYGSRWTIETCLGYLAQSLNAEINTLAYPGAALLYFGLALVLFNIISALKSLLLKYSTAADKPELSYYYMALEIAEARLGMEITIAESYWKKCAKWSLSEFLAWAALIARYADLQRYRKHRRGPKRPPPRRVSGKGRAHVSTHRILQNRNVLV